MKTPQLSVCLITYNHEKYIRQAIEGVLMQKINFDWEFIIADDCSTDMTRKIILEYKEKYPDLIRLIFKDANVGPGQNFNNLIMAAEADYIAYLEGDDYWITNSKLQKQYDLLKTDENAGLVYTNIKQYIQQRDVFVEVEPRFTLQKENVIPLMLKSKFIEFSTTMFKASVMRKVLDILKKELETAIIGDTRMFLEIAQHSDILYLNEITTVYRVADGSASHQINVNKYLAALLDTYNCRKIFVERNKLSKKLLSDSICNTNRGLINKAFLMVNYPDVIKLLENLLILDTIKYCRFSVFIKKMSINIWLKLFLSIIGIGILKQKIKSNP